MVFKNTFSSFFPSSIFNILKFAICFVLSTNEKKRKWMKQKAEDMSYHYEDDDVSSEWIHITSNCKGEKTSSYFFILCVSFTLNSWLFYFFLFLFAFILQLKNHNFFLFIFILCCNWIFPSDTFSFYISKFYVFIFIWFHSKSFFLQHCFNFFLFFTLIFFSIDTFFFLVYSFIGLFLFLFFFLSFLFFYFFHSIFFQSFYFSFFLFNLFSHTTVFFLLFFFLFTFLFILPYTIYLVQKYIHSYILHLKIFKDIY